MRRLGAEFLGTFALVFAGCGAVMVDAKTQALGHVGVALTFGLVIMAMVYATGHLSGAHINPAVSVAFSATRHFPLREVAVYVPAQVAGAVAGALLLRIVWEGAPADLGATVYRHLGIDLGAHWTDLQGRPQPIVTAGGRPIPHFS